MGEITLKKRILGLNHCQAGLGWKESVTSDRLRTIQFKSNQLTLVRFGTVHKVGAKLCDLNRGNASLAAFQRARNDKQLSIAHV